MPGDPLRVALLTGGHDRSYALGLTRALVESGAEVEVIGSDNVDDPAFHDDPQVTFRNLRGNQREDAPVHVKVARLARYYLRLAAYSLSAGPPVFHVLWNNKLEWFDRTLLMLWYRLARRKVVLTAHNVNAAARDGHDSAFNRWTLRVQYRLAHHVFVHTARMASELTAGFGLPAAKVSVIPFGINETVPDSGLARSAARARFALSEDAPVALFFGQIAPYKGLEYLLEAVPSIARRAPGFRLIVAGRIKEGNEDYGLRIERMLAAPALRECVVAHLGHVPDAVVEAYFKAADVLVLPYVHIFQSGVPFLAYGFGMPVIATDVGSLRDDVVEGVTGWVCPARDPEAIGSAVVRFAGSALRAEGEAARARIRAWARDRYSWSKVSAITLDVYARILAPAGRTPAG